MAAGMVTARNPHTGETATLSLHPASPYGSVTVHLDKDRGSGPMVYQHSAELWEITGGDEVVLTQMVLWGEERSRGPWHSSDAPGAVAFRQWVADLQELHARVLAGPLTEAQA